MQRYDDRDYARRPFEDDDRSWSGRSADEEREHRGRGERFAEGRQQTSAQATGGASRQRQPVATGAVSESA